MLLTIPWLVIIRPKWIESPCSQKDLQPGVRASQHTLKGFNSAQRAMDK